MSISYQRFPTSSDEYTPDEVYNIEPIGIHWKMFSRKISSAIEDLEEANVSRVVFLVGRYGMGKTLFVRKKLTEVFRNKPHIFPLYMPLRKLFYALQYTRKTPESFIKFYVQWYANEGLRLVDVEKAWKTGQTTTGLFRSRLDILRKIAKENINSIDSLMEEIERNNFIPVLALDELEALLTRESRGLLGRVGNPTAHDVVADLFLRMYDISSGTAPWKGLLVLASVFDLEEWPLFILREIVNYGVHEEILSNFAIRLNLPRESIDRIRNTVGLEERRKVAKEELNKIKTMFPLLQQATYQRLKEKVIKITYRPEDYGQFVQRLGLKIPKERKILLDLFYQIKLTPRTLISLTKVMKELNLDTLDYETMSKIMTISGKVEELKDILFRVVRVKHAKWHKRLVSLVEQGLLIFETDIVLENIEAREDLLNRISKALSVKIRRPVTFDDLRRVNDILMTLRLKYKCLKLTYIRGTSVYYLDENLLRWLFGDEYDVYGEKIDIEEYIKTHFLQQHRYA